MQALSNYATLTEDVLAALFGKEGLNKLRLTVVVSFKFERMKK
jgi:hypothetical protein